MGTRHAQMSDLNLGRVKASLTQQIEYPNDAQMASFRQRVAKASANLRGVAVYREPEGDVPDSWFVHIYFGQESRKLEGVGSAEEAMSAGLIDFYEAVVP